MNERNVHRVIDGIWRIESAKIIASLARMVRDVGLAEDLAQDSLIIALERWPETRIPDNPGAWLMTTAKRRAIDHLRRNKLRDRKYEELGWEIDRQREPDWDEALDDPIGDDLLRLIFTTCHPILSTDARVALTLRLLGGLTTEEIASAFLVPEATIAQRIVRAKRSLAAANVPFELPPKAELAARLSSVLEVIYLMFNEGYAASSGGSWIRPMLCSEALRLGRILAEIAPDEPEVHGLAALMEIQSSRFRARVGQDGEPILLLDQNRALWDHLLIRRGGAAISRAERLGKAFGPYLIQASIAACHARARTSSETDWVRISALYDALSQAAPSPVVELNRAVALSMAFGPAIGLEVLDTLMEEPSLKNYHLLPSVRGDFLMKLGRKTEACLAFKRAANLARNEKERVLLLKRAAECSAD
ncbi:RNA polymerase ECF family sigma subunit [Paenibacillus cellulosilyticus]|uniref:RNA polymerase ECF family sigma subunit n=1 Tax=Paenibacillus cellulosilyticus TaxID=375489 RepID=A0A2V2YUC9_9BACL|nr:RNA polymerase sigma factor [Paenibacillus cellulosilyticus]PWW02867.1 RNA polymerase ECF family sigma subunit [Paenibacillus cellulosilyticus]QKS45781.1 RNA polymerase sigma factor [Paenibacillus cellulosilyticus]